MSFASRAGSSRITTRFWEFLFSVMYDLLMIYSLCLDISDET